MVEPYTPLAVIAIRGRDKSLTKVPDLLNHRVIGISNRDIGDLGHNAAGHGERNLDGSCAGLLTIVVGNAGNGADAAHSVGNLVGEGDRGSP